MGSEATSPAVVRLASRLASIVTDDNFADSLCDAARDVLGADGASLTMDLSLGTRVSISSIDASTARLEQLEDIVCEGPGRSASHGGEIFVATVGAHSLQQWPHLSDLAVQYGLTGTFWAVPMQPARVVIGVLMLHRAEGWLTEELETVQLVANAIGTALLRDPSLLTPDQAVTGSWAERSRIYQATGMVTAQLNISPDDAAALLRAHAYSGSQTLLEVALAVIERRLDFTPRPRRGE
ncbi:MAG: GAF and ANTAR domain-containing protein [Aeromicrobium sp.]|jgi:GAF domain-containing protein